MRDRDRWHDESQGETELAATEELEAVCSICTSELNDLSISPDTGSSHRHHGPSSAHRHHETSSAHRHHGTSSAHRHHGTSSVVETGFSMSYFDGTTQTLESITIESPSQVQGALEAAASRPSVRARQNRATTFHQMLDQEFDEELESPDMFEYANPGLHMDYTDTDVDLERSLDHLDLLEYDDLSADVLSLFREKSEDMLRITAADVARGVDMQGIKWRRGFNARTDYRRHRLDSYDNYFNSNGKYPGQSTITTQVPPDRSFLRFVQNETEFKCSLVHFQLRNLLTALDRNSVYFTNTNCVKMYDPQEHLCKIVMDLSERSVTFPFKISSLAMTEDYCCVGGFFGEYALKRLQSDDEVHDLHDNVHIGLATTDMTGITNHLSPQIRRSGGHQLTISSNDSCLRKLDVATLKLTQEVFLDHPVNCSATSLDKRLQIVVADHCSSWLLDAESGAKLRTIDGHTDYSFACAWSNGGHTFATGSQDLTTRVYDARSHLDVPVHIYRASMGAPRSIKFSECGRFLAVAEPADFVHVYDLQDAERSQSIEFFGEISGIDFAGDAFFIGNADKTIGGIAEYAMRRDSLGLEDLML